MSHSVLRFYLIRRRSRLYVRMIILQVNFMFLHESMILHNNLTVFTLSFSRFQVIYFTFLQDKGRGGCFFSSLAAIRFRSFPNRPCLIFLLLLFHNLCPLVAKKGPREWNGRGMLLPRTFFKALRTLQIKIDLSRRFVWFYLTPGGGTLFAC